MATPTSNIGLISVQTEFGGSAPISMAEYVRGGLYVPANQPTSVTDGNAIPTSTAAPIRLNMFRGLTKLVAGPTNTSNLFSAESEVLYGSAPQAVATITFRTTGVVNAFANISQIGGSWYSPTQTGIGSSYYIKSAGVQSTGFGGTFTDPSGGAWVPLSSDRAWSLAANVTTTVTRTFDVYIATAPNDASIVASHTGVTLTVTYEVYEGPVDGGGGGGGPPIDPFYDEK